MIVLDRLATIAKELGLSSDVYIGDLPPKIDNCIALFNFDGLDPVAHFGVSKTLSYPIVRFVIRNTVEEVALSDTNKLERQFKKYSDSELLGVVQIGDSGYTGRDENGRTVIIVNFKVITGE